MEPIGSTAVSFAVAESAINATAQAGTLETGAMKMSLDLMRDSGRQVVDMLESIGRNIDTYA